MQDSQPKPSRRGFFFGAAAVSAATAAIVALPGAPAPEVALSEPKPEDHWTGHVGFIHQVGLENYLKNHPAPEDIEYYLCGPPMMNSAVFKMLDDLGVPQSNIAFDDFGG